VEKWSNMGRRRLRSRAMPFRRKHAVHPLFVTISIGLLFALFTIRHLETKLRPILSDAARIQVEHLVTTELEQLIAQLTRKQERFVVVQRDGDGQIVSISVDTMSLNRMRSELVSQVLVILDDLDRVEVQIPLGSLIDSELAWAKGPFIQVHSMVYGTVTAQTKSDFSSAGINQTLYRIWLVLDLPVRLYLPGGPEDASIQTRFLLCETVIVGKIPEYLFPYSPSSFSG